MARRFFYGCTGILMLALSFHLGATSVSGQTGQPIDGASAGGAAFATGVVGRTLYYLPIGLAGPPGSISDPIPGSSLVVATEGSSTLFQVMLANGDVYHIDTNSPPWVYVGNLLSAPTPTTRATWGAVKAKYR